LKRPAFQFYPADWRKDAALQSCSLAAQGLWINAICIAHECDTYGHLTVNGKPMNAAQIGRLIGGLSPKECEKLIAELEDAGVVARTEQGALFSKRMVRDEDIRNRRAAGGAEGAEHGAKGAEHGTKGGRPKNGRGVIYPPKEPPPSSSSSSSASTDSESKDSGGKPPMSSDEIIFGYGVPLLVRSGSDEKNARSFLGKLRKVHGDDAVIDKLRECLKTKPMQPLEWLAAALPPNAAEPKADPDSRSSVEAEASAKGIGPWNELDEQWPTYKARVRATPNHKVH
jgi:hypothetical protein